MIAQEVMTTKSPGIGYYSGTTGKSAGWKCAHCGGYRLIVGPLCGHNIAWCTCGGHMVMTAQKMLTER